MSYSPSLLISFNKEVKNIKSILIVIIISLLYFSFSIMLLNLKFLSTFLLSNYPIQAKINIVVQLIIGSYSALYRSDFFLLILTSILVGLNLLFVSKLILALTSPGVKLSVTVGGSTILGIVVAGCSSCGFSILSLIGLAGALAFIPFGAMGLHLISVLLLLFSLYYSVKTYHEKIVCKL